MGNGGGYGWYQGTRAHQQRYISLPKSCRLIDSSQPPLAVIASFFHLLLPIQILPPGATQSSCSDRDHGRPSAPSFSCGSRARRRTWPPNRGLCSTDGKLLATQSGCLSAVTANTLLGGSSQQKQLCRPQSQNGAACAGCGIESVLPKNLASTKHFKS